MATTFRLRPGERINEVELARLLGVSRTPVREALNRIAAEGFLTATSNRGYTVRGLDAHQLMALYEYRVTVETGVVDWVCRRASDRALAELAQFAEQSRDQPDTDAQAMRLLAGDEAFHERLAQLSGNEEFVRSVRSLNERIRFARWIDLKIRRRITQHDHSDLMRCLQARDAQNAQSLMTSHITHHLEQIVELTRAGYAEIYTGNALADDAETRFQPESLASPSP